VSQSFHAEGLILHRYPFKQSVLVKFLTDEKGLIPAVVKWNFSTRTQASKQMTVQPFSWIMGEVSGLGDVKTLKNIEVIENIAPRTYKALSAALYVNELVLTFIQPHQVYPSLLPALKASIQYLSDDALESTLRSFELFWMNVLGYQLSLTQDDQGRAIDPAAYYQCLAGSAPRLASERDASPHHKWISGEILLKIDAQEWSDPACLKEAKYLLRQWIDYHSEGKKFKTRELFVTP
jgi:DNA repair protein RecO